MDGDRPMADGRDILESKLQAIVRDAFATGYLQGYGRTGYRSENCELYCRQIQEVVISYLDGPSGDVGAQDETSEEGEMGDGVRPEPDLRSLGFKPTVFDEITDEFTKQMSMRFYPEGIKPIGHCKLEKMPDGSIHATIKYH